MYWGAGGLVWLLTSGVAGGDGDGGLGGSDSAVVGAGTIPWSMYGVAGVYALRKRRLRSVSLPDPSTLILY